MRDTEKPWRVTHWEGTGWVPVQDDYTEIPATFDNACLMAAAPILKRTLEAFLRDGDTPTIRDMAALALALTEI